MNANTVKALVSLLAKGHKGLYLLRTERLELIVRPLTFEEYKTIRVLEDHIDPPTINDTILKMSTLYCSYSGGIEYWIEYKALAVEPDYLAQAVLDLSGFENQERFNELINAKREQALELRSLIEIYICTAFHMYRPVDVQQMTLEEQIELFTKAEQALGKPIDFDRIQKQNELPVPEGMESTSMLSLDAADFIGE